MKKKSFFIFYLALMLLIFSGCGKKGEPSIPANKFFPIYPPYNLSYNIDNNTAILKWDYKSSLNPNADINSFEIFMAVNNINECKTCNLKFDKIDNIHIKQNTYKYNKLTSGYIYYFKVRAVGNNMTTDYSNNVSFEF